MAVAIDLLDVKAESLDQIVDPDGAAEALEALISRNASVRNASEVAWALWAAISFGVSLSTEAAEAVSKVEDDFVAFLRSMLTTGTCSHRARLIDPTGRP